MERTGMFKCEKLLLIAGVMRGLHVRWRVVPCQSEDVMKGLLLISCNAFDSNQLPIRPFRTSLPPPAQNPY